MARRKRPYLSANEAWLRGLRWDEDTKSYIKVEDGKPVTTRFIYIAAGLALVAIIVIIYLAAAVKA